MKNIPSVCTLKECDDMTRFNSLNSFVARIFIAGTRTLHFPFDDGSITALSISVLDLYDIETNR